MPQIIPHRELRNNSSRVLRSVEAGEVFEITNRGEVVAILSPVERSLPAGLRIRRARIHGGFGAVESISLDHPIQETLDALRDEA